MKSRDDILDAVVKRACGYAAQETVEALELVKKRVTVKDVPPDMAAAKMLFESGDVSDLTDEQLEKERTRLIKELNIDIDKELI